MAVNDIYRIAARYLNEASGDEQVNVYYYRQNSGTAGEDEVLTDFDSRLGGLYSAIHGNIVGGLRAHGAEIDNLTQGTKVGFTADWAVALGPGDGVGDGVSPQVTMLILGLTNRLRVQGRKYLPQFVEADIAGGNWGAPTLADGDAFGQLYIQSFTGASGNGYSPGTQNFSGGGALGDFTPFTGYKVMAQSRTQKSRYLTAGS